MSSPRIGEEFERAVSGKKNDRTEGLERRLGMLSYLSKNPCCSSSEIAKAMKISDRGALWHLRAMEKLEFVGEANIGKKRRFFLRMYVREGDCEVFSLVKEPRVRGIFLTVLENPGITQKELSKRLALSRQSTGKILKKLMASGILTETRDGRNVRYYPTKKLSELQKLYEERRESASDRIKEIVRALGMEYEITMDRDGMLYLKIGDKDVRFGTDPMKSILED